MESTGGLASLHVERRAVRGSVIATLEHLGVPGAQTAEWSRYAEPMMRTVITVWSSAGISGAAIVVRRPLASYLKIGGLWTDGTDGAASKIRQVLITAAEEMAWETGCIAVKLACPPDSPAGLDELPPEYVRVPAPRIAAPIPDPALPVLCGWFRWRVPSLRTAVPYMRQTTEFTCGAAALAIVMSHLGIIGEPDRDLELSLWRQATTVLACDPYGLAVAAAGLGLPPAVTVSTERTLFTEGLQSEQERELRQFIQGGFRDLAQRSGVKTEIRGFDVAELADLLRAGGIAIVLVDELLVHGAACPHWIVVHGMEGDHFIAHDPWTEPSQGETWLDGYDVPLSADALDRIAWTGSPEYRAMLAFSR